MSITEDKILRRLEPVKGRPERRFTVLISASRVEQIKQIAKVMSSITGQRITQTMLLGDAVDAYIDACLADPELGKYLTPPEQEADSPQWPANDPAGLAMEQEDSGSNGPVITL